jgi:hypothetical protein
MSNKAFSDWTELFQGPVIVTAFLVCLLHHSMVINIRGNSYRLRGKVGKERVAHFIKTVDPREINPAIIVCLEGFSFFGVIEVDYFLDHILNISRCHFIIHW